MQAIILAAGKSQRFYPFQFFGHKSMVPLMGKPLLQHTLESLKKAHFTSVVIVVGKDSVIPEKIQQVSGLPIQFVTQEETLGMGHALSQAKDFLEDTFFLLGAYHLEVADVAQEMMKKQKNKEDIVLLAKEDTILEKYGVLEVENDRVVSITEKPNKTSSTALRAVSIYLLNKSFITTLDATPVEHYHFEKALDTYAKKGNAKYVIAATPTITLKHSWDLLGVKDYLLTHAKITVGKNIFIAKSAVVEKNVVIADNVKIYEGACVKGPCYLGENVIVGNNAIVRGGVVVEKNAVIGANMEVKNSILMENATTHTGYVGDSVIGPGSRLAAGFCSANVRFDRAQITTKFQGELVNTYRTHIGVIMGEKVDVGVNVATMPGIYVGNNATIGPSTTVTENIEDNTLFYTKFEKVKKKKHE